MMDDELSLPLGEFVLLCMEHAVIKLANCYISRSMLSILSAMAAIVTLARLHQYKLHMFSRCVVLHN